MVKSCLSLLLILSIPFFGQSQNSVGLLSLEKDAIYPGINLVYPHRQSTVYLLNECGEIVHMWDDDDFVPGNTAYVLENGNLVKTKRRNRGPNDPIWAGGAGETVEVRTWDNELLNSFFLNDSLERLHHDIAPLPNGNILMVAWELKTRNESSSAGRELELLPQDELWSEMILEWDPVLDSIVWEWHAWDHLIQDVNENKNNFGNPADHPELIDINYDEHDGHPDWLHVNAIDYNPVLDQIVISVPYFNEVWIIDHSTTVEEAASHAGGDSNRGGDLLFRWGNNKTFSDQDTTQHLFFQHDINWANANAEIGDPDFGELILFNNRVTSDQSTIVVFQPEFDPLSFQYVFVDGGYLPEQPKESYTFPDNDMAYSVSLSSAQKLPNGNILACSGRWGYNFEFTTDQEIIWEYLLPIKFGIPLVQGDTLEFLDNIQFRIRRYDMDYPAFENKDLDPVGYIEQEPNLSFCDNLTPVKDIPNQAVSFYVNQPNQQIELQSEAAQQAQLIHVSGHVVMQEEIERGQNYIDIHSLRTGVYFIRFSKSESVSFFKY